MKTLNVHCHCRKSHRDGEARAVTAPSGGSGSTSPQRPRQWNTLQCELNSSCLNQLMLITSLTSTLMLKYRKKPNTFLLFTFKHFLPSIFSHFISSTLDFLQGSTKVWSLTGFPLWHPDNRECVHLILLKCAFDAFTSRHVQHCQCFAADSRATDKKTNKFAQN